MNETYLPTRKEALAAGHMFYYTGRPCKHGHLTRRYTISETCETCKKKYVYRPATQKHRDRARELYRQNPRKKLDAYAEYRLRRRQVKPWHILLWSARFCAKSKGLAFDLTHEWCASVWTGKCVLSGIEFDLGHARRGGMPFSPSIDKIDPIGGYTQDNCRFILHSLNSFKGRGTDADLYKIAKAYTTFFEASLPRLS